MPKAIEVSELGKRYVLAGTRPPDTLRDALVGLWRSRAADAGASRDLWALRDVSFDLEHGECLGVVGANGAGKSTLLKLLARVTHPTRGRIVLRGRVASLLEVGTGFHPELTGRENVFLNGALLGLSQAEIRRRFDAIVDFAGVERFLELPVKRYSSGMYMRLAFSIAAHLDPEILVVDEVLAVGDAAFQRKCLGRLSDLTRAGRTILFVSHNLSALRALCTRGILLEGGQMTFTGTIEATVATYVSRVLERRQETELPGGRYGFRALRILDASQPEGPACEFLQSGGRYELEIACRLPPTRDANVGLTLFNDAEVGAISTSARDSMQELPAGDVVFRVALPVDRLPSGTYRVEGAMWDGSGQLDGADALLRFELVNTGSALDVMGWKPRGATILEHPWRARGGSNA